MFRSWCDLGVFEKILQSLVETGRKFFLVEMDSTFCKVHQHSAGAKKILGNQAIRLKSFVVQAPMNDFDKQLYKARNIIERFFQRNVSLLFEFRFSCHRDDSNLDFTNTP